MYVISDSTLLNPTLTRTIKAFLQALAYHCGSKRVCWASQKRLAALMSVSVRTVQRAERQAIDLGLITVRRRYLKSNVYRCLFLVERPAPPMADRTENQEEKTFKTANAVSQSPRIGVSDLVEQIERVTNDDHSRGAFIRIAREVDEDSIFRALSATRIASMESGVNLGRYFVGTLKAITGFSFKPANVEDSHQRPGREDPLVGAVPQAPPLTREENLACLTRLKAAICEAPI